MRIKLRHYGLDPSDREALVEAIKNLSKKVDMLTTIHFSTERRSHTLGLALAP